MCPKEPVSRIPCAKRDVAGHSLRVSLLDVHLGELVDGGEVGEVRDRPRGAEPAGQLRGGEPGLTHDRDVAGLGEDRLVAGHDRLQELLGGLQVLLVGGEGLLQRVALGAFLVELRLGRVQLVELAGVLDRRRVGVLLADRHLLGVLDLEDRPRVGVLLVDLRGAALDLGLELVDLGFRLVLLLVDLRVGGLHRGEAGLVVRHRRRHQVEAAAGVGQLDRSGEQLRRDRRRARRGGGGLGGGARSGGEPGGRGHGQHQGHQEGAAAGGLVRHGGIRRLRCGVHLY